MATGDLQRVLASGQQGSSVLARGLGVLQVVREQGSLSVREVADRTGIPLASTYRLVRQLLAAGYLVDHDGSLHPGPLLTGARDQDHHLVEFARPVLHALAQRTELSAILTVRVHHLALTLDGIAGRLARRAAFVIGQTHGLHAGGSATPLLAFAPQDVQSSVLSARLRRYTARTPDAATLPAKLQSIRERGYDATVGEVQPCWAAVGVPAFIDGTLVCCLSLAAPEHLLDVPAAVGELRAGVRDLAAAVPRSIGPDLWHSTEVEEGNLS